MRRRVIEVLADREPADPGVFVTNEPPGLWKVGDEFIPGLERFPSSTVACRTRTAASPVDGRGPGGLDGRAPMEPWR
jgi:hypothetical protein